MPRLLTLLLLIVVIALAPEITSAAPLHGQAYCTGSPISRPAAQMSPRERRMWDEFVSATTAQAREDWAKKYKIKFISPTEMETTKTLTKYRRGRVRVAAFCKSNCTQTFSASTIHRVGTSVINITSDCNLTGCGTACACCPKRNCHYTCWYKCRTQAYSSF